jgi:serine O-acetyltransferase
MIGAGAKILGPVVVGEGAKIAAGAVVLCAVPPWATAVGVPARIARLNGERLPFDQTHIPDPVSQELCRLEIRLTELERRLGKK